jgi:hypothetical protein
MAKIVLAYCASHAPMMSDSEIELAGNGVAIAGAVAPTPARTLAYEPIYPWITGMAVAHFETLLDAPVAGA